MCCYKLLQKLGCTSMIEYKNERVCECRATNRCKNWLADQRLNNKTNEHVIAMLQIATKIALCSNERKYGLTNFRMSCYKLLHNFGFADQRLDNQTNEDVNGHATNGYKNSFRPVGRQNVTRAQCSTWNIDYLTRGE